MATLVHARDSNEQTHAQFTIDQYFWSGYQLAQAAPVTKKMMKNKQTHHHSGTRAGQYLLLPEGPTRRDISVSATTIKNDAQCIQLGEKWIPLELAPTQQGCDRIFIYANTA
jgi:hypothetical protein